MKQQIYWNLLTHSDWKLYIAATEEGLCFVGSLNQTFNELKEWAEKRFPNVVLIENNDVLQSYSDEIIEFLEGERQQFSMPMDFKGTQFQLEVWNALNNIQYGETKTYKDIADMINNPKAVRAVGSAIGKNPLLIMVPCHRVIGKNGTLTGYRGGLAMKKMLLKMEQLYKSV
ncbi:methylated-DNA--[protein]-cysteine S-methyltransferase [Bacillus sp. JJ664]